jgi:prolyl 4-hydroxylase
MSVSDLRHYLRCYDDALDPAFCTGLIAAFDNASAVHVHNGAGVRAGLEHSAWTELNVSQLADPAFKGFFIARVREALDRYNQDIGLSAPVPWRPRLADLRIKRYRAQAGEGFQPHFDACDAETGRYLVFLWYLNDVADGGQTRFVDLDLDVAPRAGRLLVFPPYWMYLHAALPPRSGDKYIISTYLEFTAKPA